MEQYTIRIPNQSKQIKKYQLVVRLSQYENKEKLKNNIQFRQTISSYTKSTHLPKIVDLDQGKYGSGNQTLQNTMVSKNIFQFNQPKKPQIDLHSINLLKQYEIVGLKQINSYKNKVLSKRKNAVIKRADSLLSLSRLSSSIKSQHQGKYLNKEDLMSIVINQKNQRQLTFFNNTQHTHKTDNQNCMSLINNSTIKNSKNKFESYIKLWNQQRQKKNNNFLSVLDHVKHFRTKIQKLQVHTLNEKKASINEQIWRSTLRTNKNVENYYKDKYIQRILNTDEGLNLKGKQKLQKQIQWVEEKDKNGCMFSFVNVQMGMHLKATKQINSDKQKQKIIDKDTNQYSKFNKTLCSNRPKKQKRILKSILNRQSNIQNSKITKIYSPSQFSHFSPKNLSLKNNLALKSIRNIKTHQISERIKDSNNNLKENLMR